MPGYGGYNAMRATIIVPRPTTGISRRLGSGRRVCGRGIIRRGGVLLGCPVMEVTTATMRVQSRGDGS